LQRNDDHPDGGGDNGHYYYCACDGDRHCRYVVVWLISQRAILRYSWNDECDAWLIDGCALFVYGFEWALMD